MGGVVWLSVKKEVLPPDGSLKFRCKKAMLSATVILTQKRIESTDALEFGLAAEARFLMQSWRYEASVQSRIDELAGKYAFTTARERSGKIERTYAADADELSIGNADLKDAKTSRITAGSAAPVLHALQVPAAFACVVKGEAALKGQVFAAWVVAGAKVYALRAELLKEQKANGLSEFVAAAAPMEHAGSDFSESAWTSANWTRAKRFRFTWNTNRNCLWSGVYSAPVAGDVELELAGASPG